VTSVRAGTAANRGPRDVDLHASLTRPEADARLIAAQRRLLQLRLCNAGLLDPEVLGPPVIVVVEGWDASGKGGSIRRLAWSFDPRHVRVTSTVAPTERERRHHFLWRFAPLIPGWGGMTIFDRSWYGRLLVERVERFIDDVEAARSIRHIVAFERGLVEEGAVVIKLWLEISDGEQLRRFEARADDPLKRWKLTEDDWRNRERRAAYEPMADEMLASTSTEDAPWDVIAAEHKRFARVAVLETVAARMAAGMRRSGVAPPAPQVVDEDD
jgi:polyphosphate kinase 2 (PPK2 family)